MMQSLFKNPSGEKEVRSDLSKGERFSVFYHDLFDYPLTFGELIKWKASDESFPKPLKISVTGSKGYYFLQGKERLIYKRIFRVRTSAQKMKIVKKVSKILSLIPSIKMVAVTGSLAMQNSKEESDIDLMIITKKGTLWITRIFVYSLIHLFGLQIRRPSDKNQKDRLCLNMWMDENDLIWKSFDRNFYTAHELAQILPIVNKDKAYEKLLSKNRWVFKYWPNSMRVYSTQYEVQSAGILNTLYSVLCTWLDPLAFWIQYKHMESRITREIVTPTRAIFHPQNWGKYIMSRLSP